MPDRTTPTSCRAQGVGERGRHVVIVAPRIVGRWHPLDIGRAELGIHDTGLLRSWRERRRVENFVGLNLPLPEALNTEL